MTGRGRGKGTIATVAVHQAAVRTKTASTYNFYGQQLDFDSSNTRRSLSCSRKQELWSLLIHRARFV